LAAALALAPLPLLGVLGYEPSLILCLPSAIAGLHLGARAVARLRAGPATARAAADGWPLETAFRLWGASWGAALVGVAVAGLVLLANALRVRNCDPAGGLLWLALLPATTSGVGAATGVALGLGLGGGPRRAVVLGVLVVVGSVAHAVWRFYATPAIFAHDAYGGYFAGALYDEDVAIPGSLVWARALYLTAAAAAVALAALCLDGSGARLRLGLRAIGRGRRREIVVAVGLVAAALVLSGRRAALGIALDAGDVARALGAEQRTAHFVLHYSPTGPFARDIALHALDAEYRWERLRALLGVEPDGPVHAFVFDNPAQKRALMGAGQTYIAKPWRREIYLQDAGWPHDVLQHELAHVFAGRWGDPIFATARRGARMNVGLIEGVAVAADWPAAPLTPHETVKALRQAGIAPNLGRVLGLGFFGVNAGQAYTTAGSFCRYLLDNYGTEKLGAIYRAAGAPAAWATVYGKDLAALEREWLAFVDGDAVVVPPREAALVKERLSRPAIFRRTCAHELALRRAEAGRRAAAGDHRGGLRLREEACREDPDDPDLVLEVAQAALAAGPPEAAVARRAAERLLGHPKAGATHRARAHLVLGDLEFSQDKNAADRAYAAALELPLDAASARLATAKRIALAAAPGAYGDGLRRFFAPRPASPPAPPRDAALDLLLLESLRRTAPDRALPHYLLGRQLVDRRSDEDGARALATSLAPSLAEPLPDARFVAEARRLLGLSRFRAGDLDGAESAFRQLLATPDRDGQPSSDNRLEAEDWLGRIAFRRAHPASPTESVR
jgi:hypothetical protein